MATERATYCRICVAGCGIVVSTEGDTVVGVRGNHEHVLSQGYTCPKGRAIPALHHHAGRLDRPVIRRGDTVVDATWDESLDDVATRVRRILDEHGPSAVGYFVGSGGYFDAAGLFTLEPVDAHPRDPELLQRHLDRRHLDHGRVRARERHARIARQA